MANKSTEKDELILEFDKTRILFAEEEEEEEEEEVRIVVSLKDVTKRKKAEEALKESKEFNKALFEYNPIETVVVDLEGRIVDFNQAKKNSGDRLPNFGDMMYRDYASKYEIDMYAELMECIKSGEIKTFPGRKYRDKFISIKISPFSHGAILTSLDITASKKAENALRESEQNYRELADSIGDIFFAMDNNLRYTYWNKASEELTGISFKEAIGKSIFDIFPDNEDTRRVVSVYKEVLNKQKSKSFVNEYKLKGKTNFFEIIAYPSRKGISVFVKDITEKKNMEQMLIQSEKMASIGTLAAGVAHEINNPMGYISSNLRMLLKYYEKNKNFYTDIQKLIEEQIKDKDIVDRFLELKKDANIDKIVADMKDATVESIEGAEKIIKIVSDLREFAREEKPKIEITDINRGIENTLNIIWNELKYKAEVIKEFGDIPEIECDIQRLEQVFMNILLNAAQAIEEKGTIEIKTFGSDNSVVIQISDTGKGMSKEEINKIFDAFYTTKAPDKGTGLGLSISYRIIQEHNGKIEVESEVGEGTTFTIKLPVKKYGEIEEYKVLIIDDDETIRNLLKTMINKYNPSILIKTAKDGFEAADILNTFLPDVVLLDIKMPGMDGFEVCRRIKADKKMKNTQVIMITNFPGKKQ